jgi:hypothetical protein
VSVKLTLPKVSGALTEPDANPCFCNMNVRPSLMSNTLPFAKIDVPAMFNTPPIASCAPLPSIPEA